MILQYDSKLKYADSVPAGEPYVQNASINSVINPDPDHIISKDKNGKTVSRYKDNLWDLSMYRTSFNSSGKLFLNKDSWSKKSINYLKFQLFILIYFMDRGRIGQISVGSLLNFKSVIEKIINFSVNKNIDYKKFWENDKYIKLFLKDNLNLFTLSKLLALHSHLISIGQKSTGINVITGEIIEEIKRLKHEFASTERQTPLIPSRIYADIIRQLNENTNSCNENIDKICTLFLKAATIPYYAQSSGKSDSFQEAAKRP